MNRWKVFKNISYIQSNHEFLSACGTRIDPFVTCCVDRVDLFKYTGKTIRVNGWWYSKEEKIYLVDRIEIV